MGLVEGSATICPGAIVGVPHKGQHAYYVSIKAGAWIGPNAVVMAGCCIGENAIVMPGAVVLAPVPPQAVVQGNPAEVVDFACECGGLLGIDNYAARVTLFGGGWRWHVVVDGLSAPCPRCGRKWDVKELVDREV